MGSRGTSALLDYYKFWVRICHIFIKMIERFLLFRIFRISPQRAHFVGWLHQQRRHPSFHFVPQLLGSAGFRVASLCASGVPHRFLLPGIHPVQTERLWGEFFRSLLGFYFSHSYQTASLIFMLDFSLKVLFLVLSHRFFTEDKELNMFCRKI